MCGILAVLIVFQCLNIFSFVLLNGKCAGTCVNIFYVCQDLPACVQEGFMPQKYAYEALYSIDLLMMLYSLQVCLCFSSFEPNLTSTHSRRCMLSLMQACAHIACSHIYHICLLRFVSQSWILYSCVHRKDKRTERCFFKMLDI
jgi:hypothetical protein